MAGKISSTTNIENGCTEIKIKWCIENFFDLLNDTSLEIRSDIIPSDENDDTNFRFQMKLQFLGHKKELMEIYYLSKNQHYLKTELKLYTSGQSYQTTNEYQKIMNNDWQYLHTLDIKEMRKIPANHYLDFKLLLLCYINNHEEFDKFNLQEAQLCNDFELLMLDETSADIKLKSTDECVYNLHKLVLSSRSAVFKAHFIHNTTESITNIIECPFNDEILKEIVSFIYCDRAPRIDEIPGKLLPAADYYQLSRLKRLCEKALYKKLTVDNAIETLQLADLHNANTLKELTLMFITDGMGQLKLILDTEGWKNISSIELVKNIFEYVVLP